jgi:Carboxypeptidase regulatory-like domain
VPCAAARPQGCLRAGAAPQQAPSAGRSRRRFVVGIGVALLLLSVFVCAQAGARKGGASHKSEDASAPRSLSGVVTDRIGHPIAGAVVYLENTRSLAIFTYITGEDGSYRFNNLSPDIDYRIHAESDGRKSQLKNLSSYDTRKQPRITLRFEK